MVIFTIFFFLNFQTSLLSEFCTTTTILQNLTMTIYFPLPVRYTLHFLCLCDVSVLLLLLKELPLAFLVKQVWW